MDRRHRRPPDLSPGLGVATPGGSSGLPVEECPGRMAGTLAVNAGSARSATVTTAATTHCLRLRRYDQPQAPRHPAGRRPAKLTNPTTPVLPLLGLRSRRAPPGGITQVSSRSADARCEHACDGRFTGGASAGTGSCHHNGLIYRRSASSIEPVCAVQMPGYEGQAGEAAIFAMNCAGVDAEHAARLDRRVLGTDVQRLDAPKTAQVDR